MRGVPEESVRRWRAQRWRLSGPAADVREAVDSVLPMQSDPAAYLSVFARAEGFEPRSLDRLVFEDRSLRIFPLHRSGPSLVPFEALPALLALHRFAAGSQRRRSSVARRTQRALEQAASQLRAGLTTTPQSWAGLREDYGEGALRALHWMAQSGEVVIGRDPPSLFGQPTFAAPRASDRVPAAAAEGFGFLEDVAKLYFRSAAPASRDDFLWWAGLSRSAARHTIEDLAGLLEELDIEGERKAHFMLEEDGADLRRDRAARTLRAALLPPTDPAGTGSPAGFAPLCEPRLRPTLAPGGRTKPRPLALLGGTAVGSWSGFDKELRIEVQNAKALVPESEEALQREAQRVSAWVADRLAALPGAPASAAALAKALGGGVRSPSRNGRENH